MFEILFSLLLTSPQSSVSTEPFLSTNYETIFTVNTLPSTNEVDLPWLSAKSYLAVDKNSNSILFEKEADTPLPMASLTKIMTALIILENHKLNEVVKISSNAAKTEGSKVWLYANEQMTVENLLKALLIKSGNDAAVALAEYHSGTVSAFVKEMNMRAQELGLKNTLFQNPHGLDVNEHYSSARDLLLLTQAAWKFPVFQDIVSTKETTITSLTNTDRTIHNTNKLLSSSILGVKTGTTDNAGECLILLITDGEKEVFTIVLGSIQRFQDSNTFAKQIWKLVDW